MTDLANGQSKAKEATGPLRAAPNNPRYFADGAGKIIYLTGSHVWNNLQDMGPTYPPAAFDWKTYLDFLVRHHHNFIRLWRWELVMWDTSANREDKKLNATPHPWARTGPGKALDGKPKFNLESFDEAYFERLRSRVASARDRGIYVSIMLFEGWGLQFVANGWKAHPFHPDNNVNKINGDANGDGKGLEVHELAVPEVTAIQEAYVRKVIDTVNDLDNVLYEISNENHPPSTEWQYHIIRYIHNYEKTKPKQHPVGMTFQYEGGRNATLFKSPADWISPNPQGGYRDNPPPADGSKVIISDTDHLWGIGGNEVWVWKSFTRGMNPIFMDPYNGAVLGKRFDPQWDPIRRSLGYTRRFAERMKLSAMTPRGDLSSTRYCLANPGVEYLIYQPQSNQPFTVRLKSGNYQSEWFNPTTGKAVPGASFDAGEQQRFTAPFQGDAVLLLKSTGPDSTLPAIDFAYALANPNEVVVCFTKPVYKASAIAVANYAIDKGVVVTKASLSADEKTVTLATSELKDGEAYTLTLNNVRDQSPLKNKIAPNSKVEFKFTTKPARTRRGLQVLYDFGKSDGITVKDVSGLEPAINLVVGDKTCVEWGEGRLAIKAPVLIASEGSASKLTNACRRSNELTIEALVRPVNVEQGGPARIVTLSADPGKRNFTLGQSAGVYIVRLRTTTTSLNGIPAFPSPGNGVCTKLSHVVYTRDASGMARIYINGILRSEGYIDGDLSTWSNDFRLALANELTKDRPWLGEFHLIAIYSRALEIHEIIGNYRTATDD